MNDLTRKKRIVNMTQGSITRGLISYAIPIILSDFLQQLYSTVDSVIVGKFVGKIALAAVGQTFFIVNMFLGFFLGVSLGVTVAISKYFGARNKDGLSNALDSGLKLSFILSIAFSVIGYFAVPFFLKLVGTTEDAYADANTYLRIYLGGICAQLMYNMLSGILKAIGDSRRPLYVLALTAGLNIVLDLLFVAVFKMGVAGAAWATVISQALSCIILWIMMEKTDEFPKPILRKQPIRMNDVKAIMYVGLPYSVQRTVIAFSNTIVVSFVNAFGSDYMAGWSIYQKIDQFVISSILSISAAITTFVAQNVGAQKPERIKQGVRVGLIVTFIVSAFYAAVIYLFRYQIAGMFTDEKVVIEIACMYIFMLATVHIVNAITQAIAGALRGLGDSITPTIALIGCYVVIRQIYLHLRWPSFHQPTIVVAAYHFTWVIAAVTMTALYIVSINRYCRNISAVDKKQRGGIMIGLNSNNKGVDKNA
jgi:putative MATE family efflux protein